MNKTTYIIIAGVAVLIIVLWFVIKEYMTRQIQKLLPIEDLEKQFDELVESHKVITEYLMKENKDKYLEVGEL